MAAGLSTVGSTHSGCTVLAATATGDDTAAPSPT